MKKMKLAGSLTMILMVLMVWGALSTLANPGTTRAFVLGGAECGLEVAADDEYVDVKRLNPGDVKESYLTVSNTNTEHPLTYYFSIDRKDGKFGRFWNANRDAIVDTEKMMEEVLQFTITRRGEDEPLFGPALLEDYSDKQEVGRLGPGESEDLLVSVYFPEEADNDYQDSSVKVQFAFHATCEAGGTDPGGDDPTEPEEPIEPGGSGGPGGPSGPGTPGDEPDTPEPLEIVPEEQPGAPQEPLEPAEPGEPGKPDEPLLVPQGDSPGGPRLPRTGQLPPWLWYGLGLALILTGLVLRRRYESSKH